MGNLSGAENSFLRKSCDRSVMITEKKLGLVDDLELFGLSNQEEDSSIF
jgi:hypothetical protein